MSPDADAFGSVGAVGAVGAVGVVAVVDDVLDHATCCAVIDRIERGAHETTRVRDERGIRTDPALRNNTRTWFDDAALAARIFAAIAGDVHALVARAPALFSGTPCACEATFRGYRYRTGERFAPHVDASYAIDDVARTLLTVVVYLNGDVAGGATRFPELNLDVKPVAGRACVFPHLLLHEGCVVAAGTKFALRTNVIFR